MATGPYPQNPPGIPPQPYPYQQQTTLDGAAPRRSNPVGVVAFIAGMLLVLWPFAAVAIQAVLATSGDFTTFEVFAWINGAVGIVIGLVAVAAGIVAVVLPGRPRVLGAIGLGIGILTIVEVIAYSAIYPLLTSFA